MWLVHALSMSIHEDGDYFTAVNPIQFYEWRFTGSIPKGTRFTKLLPPTQVITQGLIIASAKIDSNAFEKNANILELKDKYETPIKLKVGQINSPIELINRYKDMINAFRESKQLFKNTVSIRRYFLSSENNKTHLMKIANTHKTSGLLPSTVEVENYGELKEIKAKLAKVRSALSLDSMIKKGRAHEMETFRRYENIITFLENPAIDVDSEKIDFVIKTAQMKPESKCKLSWDECFIKFSTKGHEIKQKIDQFGSLQWVQYVLKNTQK